MAVLHLYQKSLRLTAGGRGLLNVAPRDERGHIAEHVAERGVEDEPVYRLMEALGQAECEDDEEACKKAEYRAYPLDDADPEQQSFFGDHPRRE